MQVIHPLLPEECTVMGLPPVSFGFRLRLKPGDQKAHFSSSGRKEARVDSGLTFTSRGLEPIPS